MTEQEAIGKIFVAKVDRPLYIGIKNGEKITYLGDDKVSTRVGDRVASPWLEDQSQLWLLCPTSNKIAVKCSTVEEKNRVIEFSRGKGKGYADQLSCDECVNLKDGYNCTEGYYKNDGFIIIPYSQFVRDYLSIGNSLADFGTKVVSDEKESREISEKSTSSNTLSELPEKWCIRIVTREINDAINRKKLCTELLELYWEDSPVYNTYYIDSDKNYLSSKPKGYIELTEYQFKKWVLKEEQVEDCEYCNGTGTTIEGRLYPSGHTEVTVDCPTCKGEGQKIAEPRDSKISKTPLSQNVPQASQTTETWQPQVGEWVYSECPNVYEADFRRHGWVVGKLLEIDRCSNTKYKIEVDAIRYPFYKGAYVWCYKGLTRKALPHEIPKKKLCLKKSY